uniref:C2H2-type domain-containing protein n=1 Tax=Electrophorus electricus TaxID=8005 RepID=A0A4W4E086_ELEEL
MTPICPTLLPGVAEAASESGEAGYAAVQVDKDDHHSRTRRQALEVSGSNKLLKSEPQYENTEGLSQEPLGGERGAEFGVSGECGPLGELFVQGGDDKLFTCNYCGKAFNRPKKVEIHQRIHTGEKPFRCNTCGKFFAEAGNLKKHQKRVHTGEKPFKCETCGKLFTEAGNLKKHQRVHTGEKPYTCNRCGKRFAWICNLRTHQQSGRGFDPHVGRKNLFSVSKLKN